MILNRFLLGYQHVGARLNAWQIEQLNLQEDPGITKWKLMPATQHEYEPVNEYEFMKENRKEDDSQTQSNTDSMEEKKVVLETLLEVEEKVLDKLQKSKFPNSVHENAQRTEIIIAKKMKLDVLKDSIEAISED